MSGYYVTGRKTDYTILKDRERRWNNFFDVLKGLAAGTVLYLVYRFLI